MNTQQNVHHEQEFQIHPMFFVLGLIILQVIAAALAGYAAHQIMMPARPFSF